MKYFIYTCSEKTPQNGYVQKTVRVYSIKRNRLTFEGGMTDQFVSEFQLVMMTMELYKMLPKSAFERSEFGGYKYCSANSLEDMRIAYVRGVS